MAPDGDSGGVVGFGTSRWWIACCLGGIALWIGITMFFGLRYGSPSNSRPGEIAFAVGGAVFFGAIFTLAGVGMRQSQHKARSGLYDRLAVHPVSDSTVRRATRGAHTIGYVYLAFGVLVTGLGLAAVGMGDSGGQSWLFKAMIALVVLWFFYMMYALRRVYSATDELFEPLGLQLADTPAYVVGWFTDRRGLVGAMTYAGARHGREVSITQEAQQAVTVVRGTVTSRKAPTTPTQMAKLTAEPEKCWRGVEVEIGPEQVAVIRRGNGAGRWFLHDLLLAEAVAAE